MVIPRAELVAPAVARHVEELGRLQLIPPRVTERPGTQLPLHHGQRCGVKSIRNAGWLAAKALGGEDFERDFNAQRCRRFTRHLSTPRTSPPRPRVTAGWRGGLPTALCYPVERFLVRTGGSKGR